jgi:hypothetical protein
MVWFRHNRKALMSRRNSRGYFNSQLGSVPTDAELSAALTKDAAKSLACPPTPNAKEFLARRILRQDIALKQAPKFLSRNELLYERSATLADQPL